MRSCTASYQLVQKILYRKLPACAKKLYRKLPACDKFLASRLLALQRLQAGCLSYGDFTSRMLVVQKTEPDRRINALF